MLPPPPPHVRAHHARVFYAPGHTHVDGHDLGTRERRHAAGARGPLAHVACDGSRHVLPALRHAFGNDPVVGEEYRERTGKLGNLGAPLSCGDTRDGVFKVAQSPQRGARWSPTRRTRRRGRTRLRARSGRARLRARRPAPTRTRARLPRGCWQARFRLLQPCRLPLCERRCGRRERARNVGVRRIVHMREARNQGQGGRHARPALVAPGLLRPEVAARAGGLPVVELVRADACAARPVEPVALGSELHVPEMGQPSPFSLAPSRAPATGQRRPSLSAISRCRYRNPPHSATVGMPDSTARRTASRIGAFSESCRAWSSGSRLPDRGRLSPGQLAITQGG